MREEVQLADVGIEGCMQCHDAMIPSVVPEPSAMMPQCQAINSVSADDGTQTVYIIYYIITCQMETLSYFNLHKFYVLVLRTGQLSVSSIY